MINDHFGLEGKLMLAFFALPLVIGLLAVFVLTPLIEWLEVDSCFDRGGVWNYERGICDHGEAKTTSN